MKSQWLRSTEKIGGKPCVQHSVTGEVALVGRYGEIWKLNNRGSYGVVILGPRVARRLGATIKQRGRIDFGDETIFTFTEKELPLVIRAIKPFRDQNEAILAANNFGKL